MDRILLTNDDGVDSPALVPFARALGSLGDVTVVVPDRERSWIGKAISRIGEVETAHIHRDGVPVTTCTGYPADATQIGVHAVADAMPELVVSGINLGINHGTAFMLSSGTVGAAMEGWIAGLPAIAFSTGVHVDAYATWREYIHTAAAAQEWESLAATCAGTLSDLWRSGLLQVADVVSVNLPFDATPETPRRVTRIARVRYGRLFEPVAPHRYRHAFSDLIIDDDLDGTDIGAFDNHAVSVTPIRMPETIEVSDAMRRQIERSG